MNLKTTAFQFNVAALRTSEFNSEGEGDGYKQEDADEGGRACASARAADGRRAERERQDARSERADARGARSAQGGQQVLRRRLVADDGEPRRSAARQQPFSSRRRPRGHEAGRVGRRETV